MSISYYLLFFFLCLSLNACNARSLGAAIDKKVEKTFHISNKNDDKGINKIPVLPKTESSLSNEVGETRGNSIRETNVAGKTNDQKLNNTKANQKISNDATGITPGAVQSESLISVSWPVPRDKRREKHPGFNSDYLPPRTHPPSHN